MAKFCLPPAIVERFKSGLVSGEVSPEQMNQMTSEDRRTFLAQYVGEDVSKLVNAEFESKLLLKNQKAGMISWAKKVMGLSAPARRDVLSKIEKLDKALNPQEQEMFLKDLVDTKLNVNVTAEEARTITKLSNQLKEFEDTRYTDPQMKWGKTYQKLLNYIQEKSPKVGGIREFAANITGLQRAVQTGFDISSAFRQAAPYFGRKEWFGAFSRAFKYATNPKSFDELEVQMYSNKYWDQLSKVKKELGLTQLGEQITQREEQFATSWVDKIPLLNASERFYTGMLNDLRFNRFVNQIDGLERNGINITADEKGMKAIAEVIGANTGRGNLPRAIDHAAGALSTTLFSPRYIAAKIEQVLYPIIKTGPARTEAAKGLATLAGLSATMIFGLREAGVQVEVDPISSDFGKAKIGNTRIDLTFGMGQYIRLLTQLALNETKSTQTGKIVGLNTGKFGSRTSLDVISDFFAGKASPMTSLMLDFLNRHDFSGNELGWDINGLKRLAYMWEPLVASDTYEAFKDAAGIQAYEKAGMAAFMSELGIGVQTYQPFKKK